LRIGGLHIDWLERMGEQEWLIKRGFKDISVRDIATICEHFLTKNGIPRSDNIAS
jgi:hypothetical protein